MWYWHTAHHDVCDIESDASVSTAEELDDVRESPPTIADWWGLNGCRTYSQDAVL